MYKIVLLPGDGIGPEVTSAAKRVINYAGKKFNVEFEFEEELIGGASYEKTGEMLTGETLQKCYDSDAVFLGAVGGPEWENLPHEKKPESALLKLRKSLGLYANVRPAKVFQSMLSSSTIKENVLANTDLVIIRELTGGIYFGEPRGMDEKKGWNTMVYEKNEVERIARRAFEFAKKRSKKLLSVDKANVLEVSQFWRQTVNEIHKNYPGVELNHMYVDNAAMQLVRQPSQFDVILSSNIFGDILSDIAGMISGSLGMLPSGSFGDNYALYEPVHGSAPDIAGKNMANPIAAISSVSMMFKYSFDLDKASELIDKAIDTVLSKGYRTQDIYSEGTQLVSTKDMTSLIIEEFERIYNDEAIQVFTL